MAISIRNTKRVAEMKFPLSKELQEDFLKQHIIKVKTTYSNNKDRAKALGVSERTLYRYYSLFSIPYERQGWEQRILEKRQDSVIDIDSTKDLPINHYQVKVGGVVRIDGIDYRAFKNRENNCEGCDLSDRPCWSLGCRFKIFKRVE